MEKIDTISNKENAVINVLRYYNAKNAIVLATRASQ